MAVESFSRISKNTKILRVEFRMPDEIQSIVLTGPDMQLDKILANSLETLIKYELPKLKNSPANIEIVNYGISSIIIKVTSEYDYTWRRKWGNALKRKYNLPKHCLENNKLLIKFTSIGER